MTVIDASNLILGRFCSVVAKRALLGEKIDIVNCENAIITGDKVIVYKKYKHKDDMGNPYKGPFLSKMPDRFVRRIVRGMLPYNQYKGKSAFKRVMCYIGIPDELKNQKLTTIERANITKSKTFKYITVGELCKKLKK